MDFKEALKDPKKIIFSLGMKGKLGFITDEKYLKLMYWANTGKKLNLENPVTFNEKLQWLKSVSYTHLLRLRALDMLDCQLQLY